MIRHTVLRRALRTAGALALVLATAAGATLSGGSGEPPAQVASAASATPRIPVDPIAGAPVPIDGAGAGAAGTAGGVAPAVPKGAAAPVGPAGPAGPAGAPAAGTAAGAVRPESADPGKVIVRGKGEFAGLQVTVAQTTHLVNQVVAVTWQGGRETTPSPMSYGQNYLELMECWGDTDSGPDRSQCQYGAAKGDARGGAYVPSRQLNYGRTLTDPAEPMVQTQPNQNVYVPFRPANGGTPDTGGTSQYYDSQSTNEVPFAPTRADGTGQVFFEIETGTEASGLGCGQTPAGQPGPFSEGRRCWLVIVPRGSHEVDGTVPTGDSAKLQSSPLSSTNWAGRMVVPLHFEPIGLSCPIGSVERTTSGNELAAEAVWRWQPVLCRQAGGIFNYIPTSDDSARKALTDDGDPGLVYVGRPLGPAAKVPGRTPIYAPLAVSGLTIAFDIESQSYSRTPLDVRKQDGQRIQDMSLSPRLVAKLITQSYQYSVNPGDPHIPKGNPLDLTSDPEFLDLNPQFKDLYFPSRIPDLLLPTGSGDAMLLVWQWLLSDPDAAAFLHGTVSPKYHDSVNPEFLRPDVQLPAASFLRADGYCEEFPDDPAKPGQLCNADGHPLSKSMRDGARGAARGDTLAKTIWDPTPPGTYKSVPLQAQGLRGVMALTTTAQAAKFGLSTAKLRNGAGEYVAPTDSALLASLGQVVHSSDGGVLLTDPTSKVPGGYPLTDVTYAATVPSALTKDDGKSYAGLLRYAMGDGQTTGVAAGQLPDGYLPLPAAWRTRTLWVAQLIEQWAGVPETTPGARPPAGPPPPMTAPDTGGSSGGSGPDGSGDRPADRSGPAGAGHAAAPDAGQEPAPGPSPSHSTATLAPAAEAAPVARTATTAVGGLRYLLPGALLAGLLAGGAGILVPLLLRKRRP
ncbi:hypothetical protein [Kitasatospora kazusensis]|uniref:hypothetical protein n=1 Tax=Kitasatospora kazusensis TaxID=407974 RepID=UPI0031DC8EFF